VPFFDLLMVLLVTCLVFVAPIRPDGEKVQAMDITISQGKAPSSPEALLAVIPHQVGGKWTFELAGKGETLTPEVLVQRARDESRKVVLVVPPATALQEFVNMQTAVTSLGLPFALAIQSKESSP
jgi:hypothetical protein